MARKRYPHLASVTKRLGKKHPKCQWPGCEERATHNVTIQWSFLRGEDQVNYVCGDHAHLTKMEPVVAIDILPGDD